MKTSPQILSSNSMKPGKENDPLIDPKYFTKTNQTRPPLQMQNKQDIPNGPHSSRAPPTIPLMSAYFPPNVGESGGGII